MQNQSFENYLHDLDRLIKEKAIAAKEMRSSSKDSPNYDYNLGHLMAFYEIISLMQQQAEAFGIPLDKIGLDDIDPDRDLL